MKQPSNYWLHKSLYAKAARKDKESKEYMKNYEKECAKLEKIIVLPFIFILGGACIISVLGVWKAIELIYGMFVL